jgi:hypothetical protein
MLAVGPHILLDKSVLEMLNDDEFSLLTDYFRLVVPPVLIDEIVADLYLKPTERRLPDEVVKRLAGKMCRARGYECVDYLHAVGGNLLGSHVPMFGQVPIGPRPNAYRSSDGEGFIYDKVPEQQFWKRLATGQFEPSDVARAQEWREKIAQIDLEKMHRELTHSAKQAFGLVTSCHDLLLIVDRHMENNDHSVQRDLIGRCAVIANFDEGGRTQCSGDGTP